MTVRTVDIPDVDFRRHRRYVCACIVFLGGPTGEEMRAADLSASGVRLHSPKTLNAGDTVEIEFRGYPTLVQGTVRHSIEAERSGFYLGIEFTETQPKLLETILATIGGRP